MTARIAQPGRNFLALAAPIAWINQVRSAWAQHRSYMDTRAELQALTDRELADIGISRLQIRDIARDAIYGK
jgi:uncharacterized protein YjiS (DUF1127 family)